MWITGRNVKHFATHSGLVYVRRVDAKVHGGRSGTEGYGSAGVIFSIADCDYNSEISLRIPGRLHRVMRGSGPEFCGLSGRRRRRAISPFLNKVKNCHAPFRFLLFSAQCSMLPLVQPGVDSVPACAGTGRACGTAVQTDDARIVDAGACQVETGPG